MTSPVAVVVDCANGVGAGALKKMSEVIGKKFLDVTLCNDGSNGVLNDKVDNIITNTVHCCSLTTCLSQCGADYVKLHQCSPNGEVDFITSVSLTTKIVVGVTLEQGKRYASLDGDADRVVYFFEDNGLFNHQWVAIKVTILH